MPWERGALAREALPPGCSLPKATLAGPCTARETGLTLLKDVPAEKLLEASEAIHKPCRKHGIAWALEEQCLLQLAGSSGAQLIERQCLECVPASLKNSWNVAMALHKLAALDATDLAQLVGVVGKRRLKQTREILTRVSKGAQTTAAHWVSSQWLNDVSPMK